MNPLEPNTFNYDLAAEATTALRGQAETEISGVAETLHKTDDYTVSQIRIFNKTGENVLHKPQGNYITLQANTDDNGITEKATVTTGLAQILQKLIPLTPETPLLICGIGNPQLAADALGAKTVAYSFPTRHLFQNADLKDSKFFRSVAMLAPNVMGNTGIETAEFLKSLVQTVKPGAVIVIDALATASLNRLGTSFQCTDTGIAPGGGVHNQRQEITAATLKVPVIAIGVPTVIYPFAIVREAVKLISEQMKDDKDNKDGEDSEKEKAVTSPLREMTAAELYQKTAPNLAALAVTPKDIDYVVKSSAEIIAGALAIAIHPGITRENYREYLAY